MMFSKLIKPIVGLSGLRCGPSISLLASRPVIAGPLGRQPARTLWGIPPTHYDMAIPKKMEFIYLCNKYWELIPVFAVTFFSLLLLVLSILWAGYNKVDVVYTTHSRDNISRTMNLVNPSAHKMLTINQKYEPWPEMQIVFDKMVHAEKRERMRALACTYP